MKKIFIYALATSMLLAGGGCSKFDDFGTTNDNPDAVNKPVPSALLTNAEVALGGYASTNTEAIRGALYGQYFSETQYTDVSLYSLPQLAFGGNYVGVLMDLQTVINMNTAPIQGVSATTNQAAIATIVQQYMYWTLTDNWGDLPYSQALQGTAYITPVYDTQEDIYKGILAKLADAVTKLDGSSSAGDVIYNGDVASWKRAANSLRLLVSLQLSKRVPASTGYAATDFKAALAADGSVITTNAQNLKVNYNVNYKSPFWGMYNGRKDYAESKTMTDILNGYTDKRIAAYGGVSEVEGNTTTSSVGFPYGLKRESATAFSDANPNWARVLRGDFRTQSSPVIIISAAEVALARAEAAQIGWTTENASTMYQTGITLSHEQWGVGAPAASYFTQAGVALTGSATSDYRKISIQRWIASYPDGHKGWNIFRKSGYPELTPAPDATNASKEIPKRFLYDPAVYQSNPVNVNAAVDRVEGDYDQDAPVWWDVN